MFKIFEKFSHTQFAFISGLAIVLLTTALIWVEKRNAFDAQSTISRNVAEITAARIQASLNRVDTQLLILATRYQNLPTLQPETLMQLENQLRQEVAFYGQLIRFAVVSKNGDQILNTGVGPGSNTRLANLSERKYFRDIVNGSSGLAYQGPIQAKLDGVWSIVMARPIVAQDLLAAPACDHQEMVIAEADPP